MIKDYFKKYKFIKPIYYKLKTAMYWLVNFFPLLIKKIRLFYFVIVHADQQTWLEFKILMTGISEYKKRVKNKNNIYYLKRQLHRLEKGLIQSEQKGEFALGYILPTVETISKIVFKKGKIDDLSKYGLEVLSKYFSSTVSEDKKYKKAKQIFHRLNYSATEKFIPFEYNLKEIHYTHFHELVVGRKSIRNFSQNNVSRKTLNSAVNTANYAPSGCNRKPYRFIIIDRKKYLEKFSSMPIGGGGNSFNAPVLVFVIGDQSVASGLDSSHLSYIDASLATMTFVYALTEKGVGSCFLNWAHVYGNNIEAMKKLRLKPYELIITCIAVGYPDDKAKCAFSAPKDIRELIEYYEE